MWLSKTSLVGRATFKVILIVCMLSSKMTGWLGIWIPEAMFTLYQMAIWYSMNAMAQGYTCRSHTLNIVVAWFAWERLIWCTKFQSSLLNIYFSLCEFQSILVLIYFHDGPSRCSHCTKVWRKTSLIWHVMFHFWYWCCEASLQPCLRRENTHLVYDF